MKFNKIGVIGAGTMGIGVAIDLALHNISIVLVDVSNEILEKAKNEIIKGVRFAPILKKTIKKISYEEVLNNIVFSTNLEDLRDCDFIVENVTENIEIKQEVYKKISNICSQDVCFGVNTSCISITKIGAATNRPDKVIGMHIMNPVFLKPVVEVIRGYHTTDESIEVARSFLAQLNKEIVVVNDYPGFVSNRISHLFMNEAVFIVQDNTAKPEQVDEIFKKCFGHAMGPLETADLIGLDTVVDSLDVLYQSYQDSKFRCCPLLRKMVEAGVLGRKSGKGFYNYKNS